MVAGMVLLFISSYIVPVAICINVAFFLAILRIVSRSYVKVPPGEMLVILGRQYRQPDGSNRGYKIVVGSAVFLLPMLETSVRLSLEPFAVLINLPDATDREGRLVNASGTATLRIGRERALIEAAASNASGKGAEGFKSSCAAILKKPWREIIATQSLEELGTRRPDWLSAFNRVASERLAEYGILLEDFECSFKSAESADDFADQTESSTQPGISCYI